MVDMGVGAGGGSGAHSQEPACTTRYQHRHFLSHRQVRRHQSLPTCMPLSILTVLAVRSENPSQRGKR